MGSWAGTGEALAWDIASDVPSTSPSHGSNSGAHGESYSTHTYAFQRSCTYDLCNEPWADYKISLLEAPSRLYWKVYEYLQGIQTVNA